VADTPAEGNARTVARTPSISVERLEAARDGRWFRRGDAPPVDLSRRPVLRAVLAALIDERHPLPVAELIARAWPGDRALSLRNRLYVSLNTLRELGLRGVIERSKHGYRIAPYVRVTRR
jgi:hypothetical protein